jgi:hypothetical protein
VPVLATYFSVRRGRDAFFKFYRFLGWYNVAHGWDFDNLILLELPDYGTLDRLESDESIRALGHRAGEWIFQRHHSMFLRERMGPDLEFHG